jgi:hypothetical protein
MQKPEPIPNVDGARLPNDSEIWKPASDTELGFNSRSGKGVFIVDTSSRALKILTTSGKQIGETKDTKPYRDGRTRFYFGDESQDNYTLWVKNGKKEWVILTDGRTKWLINLFRRLGEQRDNE